MKGMLVFFAFFLVIGVACLALGVNDYIHQKAWFAQAAQADGTLTAYDLHVRHDGKSEFCPRIEFTTQTGGPATTYGDICPSSPDKSQIGRHETVTYNPNDPSDTRSRGWLGVEGSGLVFGMIGFTFFLLIGSIGPVTTFLSTRVARKRQAATTLPPPPAGWGSKSLMEQHAERYHANQRAAQKADSANPRAAAPAHHPAEPPPDADEARLAQLKRQEAELQRKIDERRQPGH